MSFVEMKNVDSRDNAKNHQPFSLGPCESIQGRFRKTNTAKKRKRT